MEQATSVHGVQAMGALLRLLPERDPHPHLYEALDVILDASWTIRRMRASSFVRFELAVLDELGFGLDLAACAATGERDDLVYVSPKTGRAVSRAAGAAWAGQAARRCRPSSPPKAARPPTARGSTSAFRLTGFFLRRHVYEPRGIAPPARGTAFVQAALEALARRASPGPSRPPPAATG